jgi:prepilin-type N-terminal cleavage/methylation domain-containing protein/prepilin-type processing-associated H-X9-DG protein
MVVNHFPQGEHFFFVQSINQLHNNMNISKSLRKLAGFTMVELLVATAVIGVMTSLMVPTVQRATQSGKTAKCISNMRQIGFAVQQYIADPSNAQQFPPINSASVNTNCMAPGATPSSPQNPLSCLRPYGVTMGLLSCPSDPAPTDGYGSYIWTPTMNGEQAQSAAIFNPGGANNVTQLATMAVCTDKGTPHMGKLNILRADGHVETQTSSYYSSPGTMVASSSVTGSGVASAPTSGAGGQGSAGVSGSGQTSTGGQSGSSSYGGSQGGCGGQSSSGGYSGHSW